jgi:RNAse (barnase) inhibitor barstar
MMIKKYKEFINEDFSENEPEEVNQGVWHDRDNDRDFTDKELEVFDDFNKSLELASDYMIDLDARYDRVKITTRKESSNQIHTYSFDCNNQTGADVYYLSLYSRAAYGTANPVRYYKFKSLTDMLGFVASRITNKVSFKKIK